MKEDVIQAMKSLEHDDGKLLAPEVLDAARPETSPLHSFFNWDDSAAAEQYRLGQAEGLIRRYTVTIVRQQASGQQKSVIMREYVSDRHIGVQDTPPGTYRNVASLTSQQQELVVLRMRREVRSLAARYGHLPQFWEEVAAVTAEHEQESGGEAAASG